MTIEGLNYPDDRLYGKLVKVLKTSFNAMIKGN